MTDSLPRQLSGIGATSSGRFDAIEELEAQYTSAVIRGLKTRHPMDCAEMERLRVQLKRQIIDVRDNFAAMLRDDHWPLEHRQRMEEYRVRAIDWIQKLETNRKCSRCCSPMQLNERPHPEGLGAVFVHEDEWMCENPACGHVVDDE